MNRGSKIAVVSVLGIAAVGVFVQQSRLTEKQVRTPRRQGGDIQVDDRSGDARGQTQKLKPAPKAAVHAPDRSKATNGEPVSEDSPSFALYANSTRLFERVEDLKGAMKGNLSALLSGLNFAPKGKAELRKELETLFGSEKLNRLISERVRSELSEKELEELGRLYADETVQSAISREQTLMKEGPASIGKYIESMSENRLASKMRLTRLRLKQIGTWDQVQQLHQAVSASLQRSMQIEKFGLSKDYFDAIGSTMLEAQRAGFEASMAYVFQDLDSGGWNTYANIQTSDTMVKERVAIMGALTDYSGTIGTKVGTLSAKYASN